MTERDLRRFRERIAEFEAKPRLRIGQMEQLARLYAATGRIDEARDTFARTAQAKITATGDVTPFAFDLHVGNLWRLAGATERAAEHFRHALDELAPEARDSTLRESPYLFNLLLLGHDADLIEAADEFGASTENERAWAAVQTVRAASTGEIDELGRRLAEWDERADAEPVTTDGLHPSDRDVRDLLRARFGNVLPDHGESPAPATRLSTAVSVVVDDEVDDAIEGRVIGWWGHDVVIADDATVTLYDTMARSVAYRVTAPLSEGLAWDPTGACFADGHTAYVLSASPAGVGATVLRPGGMCWFGPTRHLLADEQGLTATIRRADGTELVAGRAPVAIAPDSRAVAITTDEGTTRLVILDAQLEPTVHHDVHHGCSALAWFPTGDRLVCAEDAGQTVRTIAVPTGEILDEAVLHEDDPIVAVAVSPTGDMVASIGFDGVLGVRDLARKVNIVHRLGEGLEDLAWDSSGEFAAVRGAHGWFVVTALSGHRPDVGPAASLAWHPSERRLATSHGGRLRVLAY